MASRAAGAVVRRALADAIPDVARRQGSAAATAILHGVRGSSALGIPGAGAGTAAAIVKGWRHSARTGARSGTAATIMCGGAGSGPAALVCHRGGLRAAGRGASSKLLVPARGFSTGEMKAAFRKKYACLWQFIMNAYVGVGGRLDQFIQKVIQKVVHKTDFYYARMWELTDEGLKFLEHQHKLALILFPVVAAVAAAGSLKLNPLELAQFIEYLVEEKSAEIISKFQAFKDHKEGKVDPEQPEEKIDAAIKACMIALGDAQEALKALKTAADLAGKITDSDGKKQADAADGKQANSADGKQANSADGKQANSADGKNTDSADGKQADSADGKKTDSADGKQADSADGKKTDSADGKQADSAEGKQAAAADGKQSDAADGKKTAAADGKQADAADGKKTDAP